MLCTLEEALEIVIFRFPSIPPVEKHLPLLQFPWYEKANPIRGLAQAVDKSVFIPQTM
jgi:hypothetical protein